MIVDLGSEALPALDADVAVIGAGAAGITLVRSLVKAGRHVILIESGGLDFESETADLNAGSNIGHEYYDLEHARLRLFGGTTAIWGGRCAELDAIDFERKDWVNHSGWPFGIDQLKPWYDDARRLLDLPPIAMRQHPMLSALASPGELEVRHWAFDRKFDRFGHFNNKQLIEHPRLTVLTHATVREIVLLPSGKAVGSLDVRTPSGQKLEVRAKTYVLAAGGLENPRILLASNSIASRGLGNDHDLVGRFFMEHPHARGGRFVGAGAWAFLRAFQIRRRNGVEFSPLLTPSPELQRRERLLNGSQTIGARPPISGQQTLAKKAYIHAKQDIDPTRLSRRLWKAYRGFKRNKKQLLGPISPYLACARGHRELTLVIRAEQAPNSNSRVILDLNRIDATGMPRIKLDWRLTSQDVESAKGLVEVLGRQVIARDLGRVEIADWLRDPSAQWVTDSKIGAHPIGGYHHMGTTRMADDPRMGVTNQWGRVHEIDNLYVVGSSLFPTSGWANPTLTIIALALRTADHLGFRS